MNWQARAVAFQGILSVSEPIGPVFTIYRVMIGPGAGIAGASVSITDATGTVVASATTDITGFYFMATTGILVSGANYNVRVSTVPSGYTSASPSSQPFTWQGAAVAFNDFVLN